VVFVVVVIVIVVVVVIVVIVVAVVVVVVVALLLPDLASAARLPLPPLESPMAVPPSAAMSSTVAF